MEHDEQDFSKLVAERLEALGSTPYAIEKAFDLPPDAVRNVLRGAKKSGTPLNRAREICEALGLEFYIGPPRQVLPEDRGTRDDAQFAWVPLHEATLSAGPGFDNATEAVAETLAFRREWLAKLGVPVSAARLARVSGDSMMPTLCSGDLVLIDTTRMPETSQRNPHRRQKAPIYAFVEDGEAKVKRVSRVDAENYAIMSDNPDYPPVFWKRDESRMSHFIGKVVWWGHKADI